MLPEIKKITKKNKEFDYIKISNFCVSTEVTKMERQTTNAGRLIAQARGKWLIITASLLLLNIPENQTKY